MRFNWPVIISFIGLLLVINGVFMLTCLGFAFWYGEEWWPIVASGGVTILVGGILRFIYRKNGNKDIRRRDGFLIVTLGWIIMTLFGTLPYLLSQTIPDFVNAFFETMSGYTTTGASILTDIESMPRNILFWRSFTHWIGGMGIIVMTIAILPILGISGLQLFTAESPGVSADKITPRIQETAKRLYFIYFLLTALETVLLMVAGMDFFDGINHAFATMATGGFSTRNASIAAFGPAVQYIIVVFMFLAGINYTLLYFGFKGRLGRIWKNEEFRVYLAVIFAVSLLITGGIFFWGSLAEMDPLVRLEHAFRGAFFQVTSLVTTTGFITEDYLQWPPFLIYLVFMLFFTGASTGSTSGGIKMMRHTVMAKNSILELNRQLHPNAIIPVRFNKGIVEPSITSNIMAFILIYLLIYFTGTLVMSAMGLDFQTATGAVLATLGNIGPGIGNVGPVDNFAAIPYLGKLFLTFLMLLGRLELFTVLILLTPFFWKRV